MPTRTKIVCTLGPAVGTLEKIEQLIHAGMNVARLNLSHGSHDEHGRLIDLVKQARQKLSVPVAIMLDTKGPEIRLGTLQDGEVTLKDNQELWLCKESCLGTSEKISLMPEAALDVLEPGMMVLLDNGYIISEVVETDKRGAKIRVLHGGNIRSTRGVNFPGVDVELPILTEKDIADITFGCTQNVDYIAASFVRTVEDVEEIKKLLAKNNRQEIALIAKIENRLGVQNFDRIVAVSDGIMVARGDLGVELPLTRVPRLQKMMIRKSYLAGKPSITATQMLESMIQNPRPTRAETSDVANAIYDSTSAVMLSAETAVGRYPIETVSVMKAIIKESELDFNYYEFFKKSSHRVFHKVPSSVAQATIKTAYSSGAKAIFAFSTSGSTVRLLSRLRPEMPIMALTPNPKVYHQLSLLWGVTPILSSKTNTIEEAYKTISDFALERHFVSKGDLVVITAGTPFGTPGTTNMMIVDTIK